MTNENIVDGGTTENTNEDLASSETLDEAQDQDEQSRDDEKNRQLYARVKKAEEKAKILEAKLIAQEKDNKKEQSTDSKVEKDPYELAKELSSLRDFNEKEIDIIQRYAKTWDLSLSEAAKNDDVQTLIKIGREKDRLKDNIPAPTNKQGTSGKPDYSSWGAKELEEASVDEVMEFRKFHKK